MKYLTLFFILISSVAYGKCKDVNCVCIKESCEIERDKLRYEYYCNSTSVHKRLAVIDKGPGNRVYYVFRVEGGTIHQVGIIDEINQKIFRIVNQKMADTGFGYIGQSSYELYIKNNFPNISDLELYKSSN